MISMAMEKARRKPVSALSGLLVSPALWVANSQAGLILPPLECHAELGLAPIASFVLALVSAMSASCSFAVIGGTAPRLRRFIALASGLAGLVFTYALLLQGAASVLVDRCLS